MTTAASRDVPSESVATSDAAVPRRRRPGRGGATTALAPYPAVAHARLAYSLGLVALWLITLGGAIVMLLAWQQDKSAGLLSSQRERLWDAWAVLMTVERFAAFGVLGLATIWIAGATINLNRATGKQLFAVLTAGSLVVGAIGAWLVGGRWVAGAPSDLDAIFGLAGQAACVALPMVMLDRLASAAEARRRQLHVTAVLAVTYLVLLHFMGSLSTIDETTDLPGWGRVGANMVIVVLVQAVGALAASEAGRAIDDATQQRYEIRHKFGESMLSQIS